MKEDIRTALENALREEKEDIDKYENIRAMLAREGEYTAHGIIFDIMCDEKTHINALEHILKK